MIEPPVLRPRTALLLAALTMLLLFLASGCAPKPYMPPPVVHDIQILEVAVERPYPCIEIPPPSFTLPALLAAGVTDVAVLAAAIQHDADVLITWWHEARAAIGRTNATCKR